MASTSTPSFAVVSIVERATTIFERSGNAFLPHGGVVDPKLVALRLTKWCRIAAKGDQQLFEQRLALDGLDLAAARRLVQPVRLAAHKDLPRWAKILTKVIDNAPPTISQFLDSITEEGTPSRIGYPLPFEEALMSFVRIAQAELLKSAGSTYDLLSAEVFVDIESGLLRQVSSICSRSMALELNVARLLGELYGVSPEDRYKDFVRKRFGTSDALASFFMDYSTLAKLLATALDRWVASTTEFLVRLQSDLCEIEDFFSCRKQLGKVKHITDGLSDPHNGRRTAKKVIFESGLTLIYKPKDLGLEVAYMELLAWFNAHGVALPFKTFKVLNKGTHGWVECIEKMPCTAHEEVRRFYERSGMNLCLFYALEVTDCHADNIIACGEYPVLVDMEAALHHRLRLHNGELEIPTAEDVAHQRYVDSVLRTGLLPRWRFGEKGRRGFDISGLGGSGGQPLPFRQPTWKNLRTDAIELTLEYGRSQNTLNRPSLNGRELVPSEYTEDIVRGFCEMYAYLIKNRDVLVAADGPLQKLSRQRGRFICRDTRFYCHIVDRTFDPEFMRDGADRSIYIDVTSLAYLSNGQEALWPLLRAEQRALFEMDIPYFTASPDSDTLELGPDGVLQNCFVGPSYRRVIDNFAALNGYDLEQQVAFVRNSLCAYSAGRHARSRAEAVHKGTVTLTRSKIMEEAVSIGEQLSDRVIRASDGSATWIGLEYIPDADQLQLQPLGQSLYNGRCGIGLFFAALAAVTKQGRYRELALASLQTVRRQLGGSRVTALANSIGIGGMLGVGSLVYALVRASEFLDEPDLLNDAHAAANLVSADLISRDRMFDVMDGCAGAILGLLAFYRRWPDRNIMARVMLCVEHLLNNRVGAPHRAWNNVRERPLTGFSHGAAGIAYALVQVYSATGERTLSEAASEALAYERSVFSHEAGNWPDFRYADEKQGPSYMTAWCHGGTGIGLGRIGSLNVLDTNATREEIEIALRTTLRFGLAGNDHLCCGNFGRIEFLLVAARSLSREDLFRAAIEQASWLIARARERNSFHLFDFVFDGVYNPTFFYGTAGIGYELLRLADAEGLIPSVLLLE